MRIQLPNIKNNIYYICTPVIIINAVNLVVLICIEFDRSFLYQNLEIDIHLIIILSYTNISWLLKCGPCRKEIIPYWSLNIGSLSLWEQKPSERSELGKLLLKFN